MFHNFLSSKVSVSNPDIKWMKKIPGLVRVVLPDTNHNRGFVTVYQEQSREYMVVAFQLSDGEEIWRTSLPNGGYGAPALNSEALFVLNGFSSVSALEPHSGKLIGSLNASHRIRSPISILDDCALFSAGNSIFKITSRCNVLQKWSQSGIFLFGSIVAEKEHMISLGTMQDVESNSQICLFIFDSQSGILTTKEISPGSIVSSDVSGIVRKGNKLYGGVASKVFCLDLTSLEMDWETDVDGNVGRHLCCVDDQFVYFSTIRGVVGALCNRTGQNCWAIRMNDGQTCAPVSMTNDHILVLGDASIKVCQKADGKVVEVIPVGHSPYSMISLSAGVGYVGGGEPPHHGLLCAVQLDNRLPKICELELQHLGLSADKNRLDVLLKLHNVREVRSVNIDCGVLGDHAKVPGLCVGASKFAFEITLDTLLSSGNHVLPVHVVLEDGTTFDRTLVIVVPCRRALPRAAELDIHPVVTQEGPLLSGAAIASTVLSQHGGRFLTQNAVRTMVDAVRERSGYEAFQTWRILLRRILTSKATALEELPEFQIAATQSISET